MGYHLFVDSLHHMNTMIAHRNLNNKFTAINYNSLKATYNNNNNKGKVCICMSSSEDECRSSMRQCLAKFPAISMAMKTKTAALLGTSMLSLITSMAPLAAVADGLQPGNERLH